MNITEFVNSIKLQLSDLEQTGHLGYVNGISNIFIHGLKEVDIYKRPIHCSDLKREVLYVKDNNIWEKEDEERSKMKKAIRQISRKNINLLPDWQKENQGYNISTNKKSDKYLKIVYEANGGDEDELDKIIKTISTSVYINKT